MLSLHNKIKKVNSNNQLVSYQCIVTVEIKMGSPDATFLPEIVVDVKTAEHT